MRAMGLKPFLAQRRAMMRNTPTPTAEAPTETSMLRMAELIEMLCDRAGLNRLEAKEMVKALFEVMRDALESGENVKLSGFGNFQLRDKSQHPGRHPKTGETATISARRIVMFDASQKLTARLETGRERRPYGQRRFGLEQVDNVMRRARNSSHLLDCPLARTLHVCRDRPQNGARR
jgi:integration host factor subunit alpha